MATISISRKGLEIEVKAIASDKPKRLNIPIAEIKTGPEGKSWDVTSSSHIEKATVFAELICRAKKFAVLVIDERHQSWRADSTYERAWFCMVRTDRRFSPTMWLIPLKKAHTSYDIEG